MGSLSGLLTLSRSLRKVRRYLVGGPGNSSTHTHPLFRPPQVPSVGSVEDSVVIVSSKSFVGIGIIEVFLPSDRLGRVNKRIQQTKLNYRLRVERTLGGFWGDGEQDVGLGDLCFDDVP